MAVSSNPHDFTPADARFEYVPLLRLELLSPSVGPTDGGSLVSFLGGTFHERSGALFYLRCRFNSTAVPGVFISAREVRCVTPEMPRSHVAAAITSNLLDYVGTLSFEYVSMLLVRLDPFEGPVAGGTRVAVHGYSFAPTDVYCRFDELIVTATLASSSVLWCVAPRRLAGGDSVSVGVVVADAIVMSVATYTYVQEPVVQHIYPHRGPMHGGTTLTIHGYFATATDVQCLVGLQVVLCRVQIGRHLECTVPPHPASGTVSITLFRGSGRTRHSAGTQQVVPSHLYEYYPALHVQGVQPAEGPVHGGSVLHLFCDTVPLGRPLTCRFNSTVLDSTRTSQSLAMCRAPPASLHGLHLGLFVVVELSANLQDYSSDGNIFEYHVPVLNIAAPSIGPHAGGTMMTIVGIALRAPLSGREAIVSCMFLDGSATPWIVPASVVTVSSLTCRTPGVSAPSGMSVAVQAFNATLGAASRFRFLPSAFISSLWPAAGPADGGTRIQVLGSGFVDSLGLMCKFHAAKTSTEAVVDTRMVSAQLYSANRVDCVAPMMRSGHHVVVEVSPNAQQFTRSQSSFAYYHRAAVTMIEPPRVPIVGGSLLQVHGNGFFTWVGNLRCAFRSIVTEATFASTTRVNCLAPRWHLAGLVAVEVSLNAVDFTSDGEQLVFVDVILSEALPPNGPVDGGSKMLIHASVFPPGLYHCKFNSLLMPATHLTMRTLSCTSPPLPSRAFQTKPSSVRLMVLIDGVSTPSALHFLYDAPLQLTGVQPLVGPHLGGTVVTVSAALLPQRLVYCRFQAAEGLSMVAAAQWHSSTRLECVVPRFHSGIARVEIGLNGQQFTQQQLSFSFLPPVQIHSVHPLMAPPAGGTMVTFIGHQLRALSHMAIVCTFNETAVPALVSNALVYCIAPPHAPGIVMAQLTADAHEWALSSFFSFFEYKLVSLVRLVPSVGPQMGGTVVSITIDNLPDGVITCRFTYRFAMQVNASTASGTSVVCLSPQAASSGIASITLLCGTRVCSDSRRFDYHAVLRDAHVFPARGPTLGGTRVELTVDDLALSMDDVRAGQAACRFGSLPSSPAVPAYVVGARWICASPQGEPGSHGLSVSLNGQQFIGVASYTYDVELVAMRLSPARGPVAGGATIHVHVNSLSRDRYDEMLCKFEDSERAHVVAASTRSGHLRCTAPVMAVGYCAVSVAANGVDFSNALPYEAVPTTISSEIGFVTAPGGVVHIAGRALTPILSVCSFGARYTTDAHFESSSTMRCIFNNGLAPASSVNLVITGADNPCRHVGPTLFVRHLPFIHMLSPSLGPRRGGTVVTIWADNLVHPNDRSGYADMFCRFGEHGLVAALLIKSHVVECAAPSLQSSSCPARCTQDGLGDVCHTCEPNMTDATVRVAVTLSVNGNQFSENEQVTFGYQSDVVVIRCVPRACVDVTIRRL